MPPRRRWDDDTPLEEPARPSLLAEVLAMLLSARELDSRRRARAERNRMATDQLRTQNEPPP